MALTLDLPCIETDWPRLPSGYGVRGGGRGRRQLRSNRVALEEKRARYAAGQGQKFIASRFGIGQATVSRIVNEGK